MLQGSKTPLYLSQGLMISGALNIFLLAVFLIVMFHERPVIPWARLKPLIYSSITHDLDPTTAEVIYQLEDKPFPLLIEQLEKTDLIEDGYTYRDLALGVMVSTHSFDLERALQGLPKPFEDRILKIPKKEIIVYPGLSEAQFLAIYEFASMEKWPFVAKGLFTRLKEGSSDESLMASLALTQEFMNFEKLFFDVHTPSAQLIDMLLDSDWDTFTHIMKKHQASRQSLLLEYISLHSKKALKLLLSTDRLYATKKLDDQSVMMILNLLEDDDIDYALDILASPRSQATIFMAAERLYAHAKEPFPDTFDLKKALAKFGVKQEPTPVVVTAPVAVVEKPKEKVKEKKHKVADGESLWKISKQHNVTVAAIKEKNHLSNDTLRPGMVLLIP